MATLQNQNISIHLDGDSLLGNNDTSKALKKGGGGLGGRKALNDISNCSKPCALQASKKNYSRSVTSARKDFNVPKNKFSAGAKDNFAKVADKSGREARSQHGSKKGLDTKMSAAAANVLACTAEDHFLHDHNECIKAQRERDLMDMDFFLKDLLLVTSSIEQTPSSSPHTPMHFELPEVVLKRRGTCGVSSPSLGSPISPYVSWEDDFEDVCFSWAATPNRPNH